MKYYLVIVMQFIDSTTDSKAIYEYGTLDEAKANFHKQLGGWILKDNVQHILAMVVDERGFIPALETYDRPVAEVTDGQTDTVSD